MRKSICRFWCNLKEHVVPAGLDMVTKRQIIALLGIEAHSSILFPVTFVTDLFWPIFTDFSEI